MRAFITTVAGMATRFSESLASPVPKCIYTETEPEQTLLYRMVKFASDFDRIVIVGGFMFDAVMEYTKRQFPELMEKIVFVDNPHYADYGSGWSLYLGLQKLLESGEVFEQILFAEGDLFISEMDFRRIAEADSDVITTSSAPIEARSSVAVYFDLQKLPHYIYDTAHGALEIREPFLSIYNSGQIWKFTDAKRLSETITALGEDQQKGTNLVLIGRYFQEICRSGREPAVLQLDKWVNCNTLHDYQSIFKERSE